MPRFGKLPERSVKDLAGEALRLACRDAGLESKRLEAVWFANSAWSYHGGQDCIRGEVALRAAGISAIPIMNVENACAGGATALHGAVLAVESGAYEVVLALGADKIFQNSRVRMFAGFLGGLDVEAIPELVARANDLGGPDDTRASELAGSNDARPRTSSWRRSRGALLGLPKTLLDAWAVADHFQLDLLRLFRGARELVGSGGRSPFMDVYAFAARAHMKKWGSTPRQLALIAAKNHEHGALNPLAQVQRALSPEEVLADAMVAPPLTRAMCAPIGDGAAAAIVCSEKFARAHGLGRAVTVRASVLMSGARESQHDTRPGVSERASRRAYELAAIGPSELGLAEVHDATAFGELSQCESLGLCAPGQGGALAERGATRLGGRIPVNPSGGLECRGHPIAASGLAQLHELVTQLRGEAGRRQVAGARLALAQNGGGFLGGEEAACGVHVLEGRGR
jgi:acetyl-CoA acetyltransferase